MQAETRPTRDHRIPSLDGLRCLAIAMVVVSHLSGAPQFLTLESPIADVLGDTGVRIFFVLSGFLITSILLAEHARTQTVDLRRFYARRAFRIFPAFYVFLAALAAAAALGWIVLLPGDLPKAALYVVDYCRWDSTSNFVRHIWSLSVEEQFYLVWPVALWILGPRRARWIAVISVLASPFWRLAVIQFLPEASLTIFRRFDCVSDALATGCLLASWQGFLTDCKPYRRMLCSPLAHALPVLVLLAAATGDHPHLYFFVSTSVMNLGIAVYMHRCILVPPAFLNGKAIRQIGTMSYSIYLWQQVFCSTHEGVARLPWYFAVASTMVVSAISYYALELPLQRAGRWLTRPQRLA